MSTTVQELCESDFFKNIPLVAGRSAIQNRIDYITVCNSPILSLDHYTLEEYVFVLILDEVVQL